MYGWDQKNINRNQACVIYACESMGVTPRSQQHLRGYVIIIQNPACQLRSIYYVGKH